MKIAIHGSDYTRARECVQWLIKNIGPALPGTHGTVMRGEGWLVNVVLGVDYHSPHTIKIELNPDHVDQQDIMLFMLKWA